MPTLLSRPKTAPGRRPPPATYLMLVLLVAVGAGVFVRYHSGQQRAATVQPWDTAGSGAVQIISGHPIQGPFELRVGSAMSTPMGFWPGIFLTVHSVDGARPSVLARLHRELASSFEPGPPSGRSATADIVSRYITATVQPYSRNLTPCGDRTPVLFRPVFGPNSPLAAALPTTYSAATAELVIDVVDNSDHANHGRWIIGDLPPANELIPGFTHTVTALSLGGVRLEAKAIELPDNHSSLVGGGPGDLHRPSFPPEYGSDFHYVTGLRALECVLHATAKNARPGEWQMIVDRVVPEWMVQTPRMRDMSAPLSITNISRSYTFKVGRNSTIDNSFSLYCFPCYSHQQKLLLVGGRLVRQTTRDETVTFHGVDLVYDKKTGCYEAQWSRSEPASVSGMTLIPLNVAPGIRDTRREDGRNRSAEFRIAYRYDGRDNSGRRLRIEDVPETSFVDPFNRNPDGSPLLIRIPPPFFSPVPNQGETFDDWYDVYLPGRSPSRATLPSQFADGVRALVHDRFGGVLFRVRVPRDAARLHSSIHLGEVKFIVSARSAANTYPFTFVAPVSIGSNRQILGTMTATSAMAQQPMVFPSR